MARINGIPKEQHWPKSLVLDSRSVGRNLRKYVGTSILAALLIGLTVPAWASASFDKTNFAEEYRRVLEVYASGDLEKAVRALVKLEADAAASTRSVDITIEKIQWAEKSIVRGLAKVDSEVLLPVILLHRQVYSAYVDLRIPRLQRHSSTMVIDWVKDYVEVIWRGTSRSIAADFLTSLTDGLPPLVRTQLLHQALRLDPDHGAALLALARNYERSGDYKNTSACLKRLLVIRPDHAEAQLRLAINLVRSGRRSDGIEIFHHLLDARAPDWIISLAYQELARILIEDGDLGLARRQLEQGMERFRSDPSFLIPLAYLADRQGAPGGDDLAAAMRRCAKHCSESPRSAYGRGFNTRKEEMFQKLRTASAASFERLKLVLSSNTSRKGDS